MAGSLGNTGHCGPHLLPPSWSSHHLTACIICLLPWLMFGPTGWYSLESWCLFPSYPGSSPPEQFRACGGSDHPKKQQLPAPEGRDLIIPTATGLSPGPQSVLCTVTPAACGYLDLPIVSTLSYPPGGSISISSSTLQKIASSSCLSPCVPPHQIISAHPSPVTAAKSGHSSSDLPPEPTPAPL